MLIVNLYLCCAMNRYGGISYRRKTSETSSTDSNPDDVVSKTSTVHRSEKQSSPGMTSKNTTPLCTKIVRAYKTYCNNKTSTHIIYIYLLLPTIANVLNPVMVMQQPQEFDPYINARSSQYGGSQYGSRYIQTFSQFVPKNSEILSKHNTS